MSLMTGADSRQRETLLKLAQERREQAEVRAFMQYLCRLYSILKYFFVRVQHMYI